MFGASSLPHPYSKSNAPRQGRGDKLVSGRWLTLGVLGRTLLYKNVGNGPRAVPSGRSRREIPVAFSGGV